MEQLPQSTPAVGGQAEDNVYYTMGKILVQGGPQGYLASMDGYMHRLSLIIQDITNK